MEGIKVLGSISDFKYVDCPKCKIHIPVDAIAFNNADALVFVCKECSRGYHHKLGEENPTEIIFDQKDLNHE